MSAILKTILSSLSGGLFKEVRQLVDDLVTTREEKMNAVTKLEKIKLQFEKDSADLDLEFEKQLTERQSNDTTSDSWLPKNIRPLALIFLIGGFTILALLSGIIESFEIDEVIVETFKMWGSLALMFYFGSRGVEKVTKIKSK